MSDFDRYSLTIARWLTHVYDEDDPAESSTTPRDVITDRGHAITVARSRRPVGPFEPAPHNPILTAAGTGSSIQNTGHADLVDVADGQSVLVLLGVRPLGLARSFSPLGRETFLTRVRWVDGWPHAGLPELGGERAEDVEFDFESGRGLDDPEWIAVRAEPESLAVASPTGLVLTGQGHDMGSPRPCFVGQRQRHLRAQVCAVLDVRTGRGGVCARNAEDNWFGIEAHRENGQTSVTAHAVIAGLTRAWSATLPPGDVELRIEMVPPPPDFAAGAVGGDRIRLRAGLVGQVGEPRLLAELDGRHWSFETAKAFTGRVFGVYAVEGTVTVRRLSYRGADPSNGPSVPVGGRVTGGTVGDILSDA